MENYENNQIEEIQTEDVYVTNGVIKAADWIALIGAGLLATGGIMSVMNNIKRKRILKEQADFRARILKNIMIDESITDEQREKAIETFNKMFDE